MTIKAHKPVKIEGVTVVPQWDWSPWYRKSYGMMMRGQPQDWQTGDGLSATKRRDGRAAQYARWLAGKRGVDLSGANSHQVEHGYVTVPGRKHDEERPRAVVFIHDSCGGRSPFYRSGGFSRADPNYIKPDTIARIEIPGWDVTPEAMQLAA